MFKKEIRLKKRADFLLVKDKGKVVWGKYLGVSTLPAANLAFGFVVNKKTMPKAVDRNRFKRLAYQAITDLDFVTTQKKQWIVFIAKQAALAVDLGDLKNEINNLMDTKNL